MGPSHSPGAEAMGNRGAYSQDLKGGRGLGQELALSARETRFCNEADLFGAPASSPHSKIFEGSVATIVSEFGCVAGCFIGSEEGTGLVVEQGKPPDGCVS